MSRLACLTPQQLELLREADVPVLLPRRTDGERIEAGAQTTTRASLTRLVAFSARVESDAHPGALEILTIARETLLASLPPAERSTTADQRFMSDYLEREAVSALAMRTLELPEGAAYALATPLDQLISTRATELPSPHAVEVHVDGTSAGASSIAFGGHTATWAEIPAQGTGFIVYTSAAVDVPELTACRV